MNSAIGQTLNLIKAYENMRLFGAVTELQECFSAISLWFDSTAVVLRSALRGGKPGLDTVLTGQPVDEPTVTQCSHEEAAWLMQAVGTDWFDLSEPGCRFVVTHATACAYRLELACGVGQWLTYRTDLDGCWVLGDDTQGPTGPNITTAYLTTTDSAFGWLLPQAPYEVVWNGQRWQDLATAWACAEKRAPIANRDRLFQHLYCLRLMQHPNLLRRFGALRHPVYCHRQPWLAQQIEAIRANGVNLHPEIYGHEYAN